MVEEERQIKKNAKLTRLSSEPGDVAGRISPDGRYLVFRSGTENMRLMDLSTKEEIKLFKNDTLIHGTFGTSTLPVWSLDSKKIAYVSSNMNAISIIDINTKDWKFITEKHRGRIFHIDWSANGEYIAFMKEDVKGSDYNMSIGIVRSDGSDMKILFSKDVKSLCPWQVAWYPDNKRLAFYFTKRSPNVKKIYVFNIEKNKISEPLWNLKDAQASRGLDGLDYSPDGKFLIFPELVNGFIELVALPVKNHGTERAGNLRVLSNLSGKGIPFCLNLRLLENH